MVAASTFQSYYLTSQVNLIPGFQGFGLGSHLMNCRPCEALNLIRANAIRTRHKLSNFHLVISGCLGSRKSKNLRPVGWQGVPTIRHAPIDSVIAPINSE